MRKQFDDIGYADLAKSKPEVINEAKMAEYDAQIPEIDIEKIRTIDLNIKDNKITSLDDSIRVLKQIYDKGSINAYEEVKILFLDNSNKVIGIYNHSKGGITGTVIDVEMVCALALKCLAKGVIMSHNHPSGALKFSNADIQMTKSLKNALNLFNIALLDSIVITEYGFASMVDEGILVNGGSIHKAEDRKNFFDDGGEVEFIEYGDSEIMFEPHYKKYYANEMEFDNLEDAKNFIDSGEVPYFIKDAYAKGLFKKGGRLLSTRERYIAELKGLSGLQQNTIEDYIDENNLTSDEILHIVIGLGRKQISRTDVSTAIVGAKNNAESKKLLAFAKSKESLKAEYGAFMDGVYAGGGYFDGTIPKVSNYMTTYVKGGMIVTSIKDIPNFKKNLDEGKITYRGLGMGKVFNDFYDIAGESGTRIKVDGKEYFITDSEFDTFSRGSDGKMRIKFDAPQRKG